MSAQEQSKKEETVSLAAEWARGRDTIDKCDERISDIRKQGLTFLTGLVTAQALLGVVGDKAAELVGDKAAERNAVSFTLLAFSLCVILAVRLFEKQHQLLQAAAASRCLVIESYLSAELTDTITDRHVRQRWPVLTFLLYLSFGALALVLYDKLRGNGDSVAIQLGALELSPRDIFALFAGALVLFSWIDLRPTSVRGLDWSLSAAAASARDVIQVRVVNLDRRPRRLPCYPQARGIRLEMKTAAAAEHADNVANASKADDPRTRFKEWVQHSWWRAVDSVPGRLELAIKVGCVTTLLLGLDTFAAGGLLLWTALAAALVGFGVRYQLELVQQSVIRWPLGALAILGVDRFFHLETLHNIAAYCRTLVGPYARVVTISLFPLGVATVIAAYALWYRSTHHETVGVDDSWPDTWRWSKSRRVCFLPPLGSFVWTLRIPQGTDQFRIRLEDKGRGHKYLRKPIVVLP